VSLDNAFVLIDGTRSFTIRTETKTKCTAIPNQRQDELPEWNDAREARSIVAITEGKGWASRPGVKPAQTAAGVIGARAEAKHAHAAAETAKAAEKHAKSAQRPAEKRKHAAPAKPKAHGGKKSRRR